MDQIRLAEIHSMLAVSGSLQLLKMKVREFQLLTGDVG
jgi:hypothetical protein